MKDYSVKQNKFLYWVFKGLAKAFSKIVFKRRYIRNELKDVEGPCVVIANHEAALDFVNIIGASRRSMHFVISQSFYLTMPLKWIVKRLGFIPKQQFQTEMSDIRRMKGVIDRGGILVIFPTGLMSDDGTPTPLPVATYKFLAWLGADVYMAKNTGTYFAQPKWRVGGIRSGRTNIDIYKLFERDELSRIDAEELCRRVDEAMGFDAYREQEELKLKFRNGNDIRGLENVLYMCPVCGQELSLEVRGKSEIYCRECGYTERADEYQLLHKVSEVGEEIRYASDWSEQIHRELKRKIVTGEFTELSSHARIDAIAKGEEKFHHFGEATVTLTREGFTLMGRGPEGEIGLCIPADSFASLPYKPGAYIELQDADKIYRCYLDDGRLAAKFVDAVEAIYELHTEECEAQRAESSCV